MRANGMHEGNEITLMFVYALAFCLYDLELRIVSLVFFFFFRAIKSQTLFRWTTERHDAPGEPGVCLGGRECLVVVVVVVVAVAVAVVVDDDDDDAVVVVVVVVDFVIIVVA
jgi:hypothetical protein